MESWSGAFETVFLERRHSLQVVAPGRSGVLPKGEFRVLDSAETIKAGHDTYRID